MVERVIFRPARPSDLPEIQQLLAEARLTLAGVEAHIGGFLLAIADGQVAGCAALELYGSSALLRSVAVSGKARGCGLGQELVRRMLDQARIGNVETVFLLTETAADFFRRFGFEDTSRQQVPSPVHVSVEFQGACPASCQVMRLELRPVATLPPV